MAGLKRRQASAFLAAAWLAGRVVAATTATAAGSDAARWLPWPAERTRPDLRLPDLDGHVWDLAQEQGRPVVLNFWATWCEPCRAEMQSFEVLQNQFRASGLKVVAINFKEGREPVQRFQKAQGLSLAMVRDSYGEAAQAWSVHTFPTTFVINRTGRPVLQAVGEVDWDSRAVFQKLQAVL